MEESLSNTGVDRQENDNGIFNVRWIITTLFAIWPWFVGSMLAAYLLCNLYLRYTIPIFKLGGEVIISDNSKGSSAGANGFDQNIFDGLGVTNNKTDVNNVIRVLRSRSLMTKVVKELGLNVEYLEPGKIKMSEYYSEKPFKLLLVDSSANYEGVYKITFSTPENYKITFNNNTVRGKLNDTLNIPGGKAVLVKGESGVKSNTEYVVNVYSPIVTAGRFSSAINVARIDKISTALDISIIDEIPERGIDIINTLARVYEQTNITDRNRISTNTINFINDRLQSVEDDLFNIEKTIETFKESNSITDVSTQSSMLLASSTRYSEEEVTKEVQLKVLEDLEKYILSSKNAENVLPVIPLQDAAITQLVQSYNSLQGEIQRMGLTNTASNPYVVNLYQQLATVKDKLLNAINISQRSLSINIAELKKRNQASIQEIRKIPTKQRVYLEYSRQQNIKQELYLYLLKKREETEITKSSTISNVVIVDGAAYKGQVAPNRSKLISTSLLLGFIAPIIGLAIRRTFNTKIIARNDISKFTNIPIIAEIGHNSNDVAIAVKQNSNTILAEQFRVLRTNLQFVLTNKSDKTILLTSSMSGEGKSFIAINLASTLAISGKKVVLMEMDLRRPKVTKNLGLKNEIGLSTYAIGQNTIDEILLPSGFEDNLYVVSSGPIPPNPAELLLLPIVDELFMRLKERFDYIVIDTAPIGLVTDAQLLSHVADATLYIVRQGYTYKQQMQIVNDLKESGKMPKLSLVINDVLFNRGYSYGYGYGYEAGYGNSYGYGYRYGYSKYGYGYGKKGYYAVEQRQSFLKRFINRKKNTA